MTEKKANEIIIYLATGLSIKEISKELDVPAEEIQIIKEQQEKKPNKESELKKKKSEQTKEEKEEQEEREIEKAKNRIKRENKRKAIERRKIKKEVRKEIEAEQKDNEKSKEEKLKDILEDNESTKSNIVEVGGEDPDNIKDKYVTYAYLLRELTILSVVGYEEGTPFVKPTANHDVKTLQKATRILSDLKELEWTLNGLEESKTNNDEKEKSFEDYVESIDENEEE